MSATILIVEDHDEVRRSLRDWLEIAFPQCRVVEAASGEEAIALTQTESPRVVVMDITLPGMNGTEATRQIKALLPSAQIVMLTIHDDEAHRTGAAAAGASAYVSKRAISTELIPTLDAVLVNAQDWRVALLHTLQLVRTKPVEIEFLDDYIEKMEGAA